MPIKREVQESVDLISAGNFRNSDIRDLFVQLRYSDSSILYDIANFIVHRGRRNQGIVFDYSRSSISDTLKSLRSGRLESSQSLGENSVYSADEIFDELIHVLSSLKIEYSVDQLSFQKTQIIRVLKSVIDGTVLELSYKGVKYCKLKLESDGYIYVIMAIGRKFDNKLIRISGEATVEIKRPLF